MPSTPLAARLVAFYPLADRFVTPLAQLATRIVFGQAFLLTGLGKLRNLADATAFFESLGIPLAQVQAPFVAAVEFVGGALLLLGLGTRLASALLASTMVVALLTAHRGDFALDASLADIAPLPFLVAVLWLLAKGAGRVSVDHVLARRAARAAG